MGDNIDKDIFQYVLIGIFCVLAALGVIVFATFQARSGSDKQVLASLVIWGTRDQTVIMEVFKNIEKEIPGIAGVRYLQFDPETIYQTFLEEAAVGRGPDLVLVDQSNIYLFLDKAIQIPYETFPEQTFKATYAEGAEVFMRKDGILAIPFIVDPIVMFWNRDMLTNAGIAVPPQYWDELPEYISRLNRVDASLNVLKSTIAFGETHNVAHYKHILSMLMLQAGAPVTRWSEKTLSINMRNTERGGEPAGVASLRFYTDFSNPTSRAYSWNRSLPEARAAFIAGDLAFYFAPISEVRLLSRLNPNLNFDIALVPQVRGTQRRVTSASIDAFIIPRASKHANMAYTLAMRFASPSVQAKLSADFMLPPIRRDLLSKKQTTGYWSVAYDSAIIAKTWIDPNPQRTADILRRMVESVKSGARGVADAVSQAEGEMGALVR